MLNCLSDFMANRTFQVRLSTILSRTFTQENGVAQGCILSMTLFIIKMNSVNKIIPSSVMHSIYVNDLQVACRASNLPTCERQLQITINNLTQLADKNGFRFSTDKTVIVLFSQKRGLHCNPVLTLDGTTLPVKDNHKSLGVTFDTELNFLAHCNTTKIKTNKALNTLKVLSHKHWGSDRTCLLRIYRSLVRSILDYGSVVYGAARQPYIKRLDPFHSLGLRLASGAYRTSPVQSLYVDCNEPSLQQRRALLTLSYVLRIRSSPQHICYSIVTPCKSRIHYTNKPNMIRPLILRHEEYCQTYDVPPEVLQVAERPPRLPPRYNFSQLCDWTLTHLKKKDIPQEHIIQEFRAIQEIYKNYTEFYTDGSKTQEYVGVGITTKNWQNSIRISNFSSVFTAEVLAIWTAVKKITSDKQMNAIVYTDSLSALSALNLNCASEPLLRDILNMLAYNEYGRTLRFCWVPSHVGIPGNEAADRCAFMAPHKGITQTTLPYRDSIRVIHKVLASKWQLEWDSCINNKLHTIKPLLSEWKSCSHKQRFYEVIVCRLRIGHTHLTHNFLFQNENPPTCEKCHEPLTVMQIIMTCPHIET
nr:uncharacterized protein LOC129386858 [Dermacentor andersoni]XP_054931110.1 uncharacterized protein LOC129386858 [Dermacentor andersoni]XP_054931111.1 uncharacterized protein LOC129386858 [Dermacentor andersoni]XP_054931112.1 uncharacterized protein LOC129386858 [Dermacentor andersoni]XP_054931113.1 uncharacterized protein LOC129386858 [Dermacentor andersoni]